MVGCRYTTSQRACGQPVSSNRKWRLRISPGKAVCGIPDTGICPFHSGRILEDNRSIFSWVRCFMSSRLPVLLLILVGLLSTPLFAQQIRGDYIETRTSDVYTGQCFANGEVNLVGNEAILGWHIQNGTWDGVSLDGLTVAAAVRARATLGDPYGDPYPAKSVILVDEQANPAQQAALASFARQMGGDLLKDAGQVIPTTMEMIVNHE